MRTVMRLMLLLAVAVLVACGASTESRFLGKWTASSTGASIEFFKDGKVQFGDGYKSVAGNWRIVSDGRVRVEISRGAQYPTDSFTAALQSDDSLAIEAGGVEGATFRRQ